MQFAIGRQERQINLRLFQDASAPPELESRGFSNSEGSSTLKDHRLRSGCEPATETLRAGFEEKQSGHSRKPRLVLFSDRD